MSGPTIGSNKTLLADTTPAKRLDSSFPLSVSSDIHRDKSSKALDNFAQCHENCKHMESISKRLCVR